MTVDDLWLVRHGESIANIAATRAERDGAVRIPVDLRDADVPLSPAGEEQAAALGTWVEEHAAATRLWVSPYRRARQTLEIALGEGSSPVTVTADERLRDRELGVLDLLTRRGVESLHPEEAERRRRLGKFYHRPPGGESWADVALRIRAFLDDALNDTAESALVVAHDAVVMLFLYVLLPLEEEQLLEFAASHTVLNASVTHLRRNGPAWELVTFSSVEHLQDEGAPVTVHPGDPDGRPE